MLTTQSIEKALALTGKKMKYMEIGGGDFVFEKFSIEKFCYYLLSPEFIEKYTKSVASVMFLDRWIGNAIYEYQKGKEQPLQYLLNKIP